MGEKVTSHIGSRYNPQHKRNEHLISLLDKVYVASYDAPRERRETDSNGWICEQRTMGSCCFMIPLKDPARVSLMDALLKDSSLFTGLIDIRHHCPRPSFMTNSDDYLYEAEIRHRKTLSDSGQWEALYTIKRGHVYDYLFQMAMQTCEFKCKAVMDEKPTLFLVTARKHETDILEHLSTIICREQDRNNPNLLRAQFEDLSTDF
ncbi:uncharacterized protein M437DRAFT_70614 [Aureobasidium melanogenum CBS 110374]|uniref:Uncharacterized protein n=1 Tax=Aureobasidium melanogenum (strain CBS 110374) TaxID=1043003 RepID=A0A074VBH1_AURM1|nr:uncharacterized protein M437DRAFT_70614 [Aureobasidium melanogenum CBS 110374]KEQ57668.1 hypothetical protein M437DRAFT_70614 [Aureobasidium melanogenum CBS 110374]